MAVHEIAADDFEVTGETGSTPAAAVRRVAEACDDADGAITLNEQACLQLKYRGLRDARLWVATDTAHADTGGSVDGFALLRGIELDLAVHPERRGNGIGTALAATALDGLVTVEAWSHADHPAAARIAGRFGIPRERDLLIMSRPTAEPLGEVPAAEADVLDGLRIRTFTAEDLPALLAVNSAAFAHHPEQGEMTSEDFLERTSEDWFDPEGLFLAFGAEGGELLGFHWTKVHRDEDPAYGEVYVVAVNPRAAGRGIGKVLTRRGLEHLAATGVGEVILYVDGDNEPAIAVYRGLGFRDVRVEAQYRGTPRT